MPTDRRAFLERLTAGAMLATLPLSNDVLRHFAPRPAASGAAEAWDLSWTKRVTGKYRAIFDVPVGKGRVIAFTFDALHRYLNHHEFPLVWNALLNWDARIR